MLYIILLVLVFIVIVQARELQSLRNENRRLSLSETRYQEVRRWCASYQVDFSDIESYVSYTCNSSMRVWYDKTNKNPLIINHFREYVISKLTKDKI